MRTLITDYRILIGDLESPYIYYDGVISLGPVFYSCSGVSITSLRSRDYLSGYTRGSYDRFAYQRVVPRLKTLSQDTSLTFRLNLVIG